MQTLAALLDGLRLDPQGPVALYAALAGHIESLIRSGQLAPGDRLPAQRDIARTLNLNLTTVSRAFRVLNERRLVASRAGRGSLVMAVDMDAGDEPGYSSAPLGAGLLDLTVNRPATDGYLQALGDLLPHLHADERFNELQDYCVAEGPAWMRILLARWLLDTGALHQVEPEQIIITYGAQHALSYALRLICHPGGVVLADMITYQGLVSLCQAQGLTIQGVAMDAEGMKPDALEALCRELSPKAVFLTPTLHNPTAHTLSIDRRQQLAQVAKSCGVALIEDDVYRGLHDNPGPSLTSLAPADHCYIGGFSKSVAPGLRLGFLVVPKPLAARAGALLRTDAWCVNPLSMLIAARMIESGRLDQVVSQQKNELAARQALLVNILKDFQVNSYPGSTHAWLHLPAPWTTRAFVSATRIRGVAVLGSDLFCLDQAHRPEAVRLNLASPRSRADLERALKILRDTLRSADGRLAGAF